MLDKRQRTCPTSKACPTSSSESRPVASNLAPTNNRHLHLAFICILARGRSSCSLAVLTVDSGRRRRTRYHRLYLRTADTLSKYTFVWRQQREGRAAKRTVKRTQLYHRFPHTRQPITIISKTPNNGHPRSSTRLRRLLLRHRKTVRHPQTMRSLGPKTQTRLRILPGT